MTLADELARLQELRDAGSLTEVEFEEAKRRVLDEHSASARSGPAGTSPGGPGQPGAGLGGGQPGMIQGMGEETWCVLMHLSQLLAYSLLGIVVPVVMWAMSKDQSDLARRHGARMMNWLISNVIYAAVAGALCVVLIGIPLVFLVAILQLVFPIIAALKANSGEVWSYPLAIRFIPED
jgi:uncharacterized Tic20 family protein